MPYKSAAPALNDLLGGHVDLMFDAMPVEVGQVQAGNVLGFMVTGPTRVTTLPQVPWRRKPAPGLDVAGWFGFLAPPKTPAAVIMPIHDAWRRRSRAPTFSPSSDPRASRRSAARPSLGRLSRQRADAVEQIRCRPRHQGE